MKKFALVCGGLLLLASGLGNKAIAAPFLPTEFDSTTAEDLQPITPQSLTAQHADDAYEFTPLPGVEFHPHESPTYGLLLIDQLEYRTNKGEDTFNWDLQGWRGGDYRRVRVKSEGEISVDGGSGEQETQLLYSKLVIPFWELQTGLRYDYEWDDAGSGDRLLGVIGMQGLLPYKLETDAALFISEDGDLSARLTLERQLLLTQRLILQPELEINVAAQTVEEFGVGSGLNDIGVGLRLRYEISRNFAPYIGIDWSRKFAASADFARAEKDAVETWAIASGVRLLF